MNERTVINRVENARTGLTFRAYASEIGLKEDVIFDFAKLFVILRMVLEDLDKLSSFYG